LDPRGQGRRSRLLQFLDFRPVYRVDRDGCDFTPCGRQLEWDPAKMRFTNNNEANKYVKPVYRKGWAPNWKA